LLSRAFASCRAGPGLVLGSTSDRGGNSTQVARLARRPAGEVDRGIVVALVSDATAIANPEPGPASVLEVATGVTTLRGGKEPGRIRFFDHHRGVGPGNVGGEGIDGVLAGVRQVGVQAARRRRETTDWRSVVLDPMALVVKVQRSRSLPRSFHLGEPTLFPVEGPPVASGATQCSLPAGTQIEAAPRAGGLTKRFAPAIRLGVV